MPRVVQTNLETEGFICSESFSLMISADELKNMSAPGNVNEADQSYFEF